MKSPRNLIAITIAFGLLTLVAAPVARSETRTFPSSDGG